MAGYDFPREVKSVPRVETRHRRIATAIPAPGTGHILSELDARESRSMHGQMPIVWDRAVDYNVVDISGNKWIDFTSTIFVSNIGHANPRLVEALKQGLDRGLLHSYTYASRVRAEYLRELVDFAGPRFEKAFLFSAGTEATEAALKLMRMHGQKLGKRKPGVICIEGNWHGRTMGAQMMSSNAEQKAWVGYLDSNIHHIPFPYPWSLNSGSGLAMLERSLDALAAKGIDLSLDICGFMLETFQGWAAAFYPVDFVQGIAALCQRHNILLAFDEMQSGFARTGKRFGYEHYAVEPDLIAVGKGMGSGLPVSGVIGRAEIIDLPSVGNMSSTHSANPLVCIAGLTTLKELDRLDLVVESQRKGEILHARLNKLRERFPACVRAILGKGLVAGIILDDQEQMPASLFGSLVSELCMQRGVLVVHTGRESIKLGPPLTIPDDALLEGLSVLEESIGDITVSESK
jgi:4-aminobutyrate aminotransferase-like enzyme